MVTVTPHLSGRRAEAARNDELILAAAREVFLADAGAPIAAVAARARVGISALYRRYPSKEVLLQRLALDGLERYIARVEAALRDDGDPWAAFTTFMHGCLDDGTGALTLRLAGRFPTTAELHRAGGHAYEVTQWLLDRTKAAGGLRPEIEVGDLSLLFEQLQAVQIADPARTRHLRHRYLTLLLDALHSASPAPLPGPAPSWAEISGRYDAAGVPTAG